MNKDRTLEAILWSIALPGFGQILNKQIIKGILFITLEFLVNVFSNFNTAIMLSFLGDFEGAANAIDYQWLMFYPCLYFFAMWDAHRGATQNRSKYIYLPYVFSAYFVTVGLMLSPKLTILGVNIGPVFMPMLFVIPGLLIGFLIKAILSVFSGKNTR
ncbi:hypothetical protein IMZ08_19515 [Bacillus luteolus]|uniref:Uncharacterized protein n=1 Tax=Litchfieldia luteola TaxID=682179 RepID=A0ABR9QPX0_9BACI|nr:hypothetical protein [Cytobacillus luteolus]MBE4910229.1 hypothetical protein [Cytobacillus luteolus]MBP1942201.1 hypothetical protein [Cytobacillus luteolus]